MCGEENDARPGLSGFIALIGFQMNLGRSGERGGWSDAYFLSAPTIWVHKKAEKRNLNTAFQAAYEGSIPSPAPSSEIWIKLGSFKKSEDNRHASK